MQRDDRLIKGGGEGGTKESRLEKYWTNARNVIDPLQGALLKKKGMSRSVRGGSREGFHWLKEVKETNERPKGGQVQNGDDPQGKSKRDAGYSYPSWASG